MLLELSQPSGEAIAVHKQVLQQGGLLRVGQRVALMMSDGVPVSISLPS